ncbi:PTS fructose transporter subunit IIC, partial [Staphylococcus pseudintermedius]
LKKHYPYFILGFIITALMVTVFNGLSGIGTSVAGLDKNFTMSFSSLPMLAIAAIGFALAAMEYSRSSQSKTIAANHGGNQATDADDEGEIDDDEL